MLYLARYKEFSNHSPPSFPLTLRHTPVIQVEDVLTYDRERMKYTKTQKVHQVPIRLVDGRRDGWRKGLRKGWEGENERPIGFLEWQGQCRHSRPSYKHTYTNTPPGAGGALPPGRVITGLSPNQEGAGTCVFDFESAQFGWSLHCLLRGGGSRAA